MTWADRLTLRDEANRRVRVLTALAGAGSVAGTGAILVGVAGSGAVGAVTAAAAPQVRPHPAAHVPAGLLATKRHHHRPATPAPMRPVRPVRHASAPAARSQAARTAVRPAAPKHVAQRSPAPAPPPASTAPQPQPTATAGSGGCCSHSGGSH